MMQHVTAKLLRIAALPIALVALAGVSWAEQNTIHRATFKEEYPGGTLAVVAATSINGAQNSMYVIYSANGCVALPRSQSVFVYANHYFGDENIGKPGIFLFRVTGISSTEQTVVHAYRNKGWKSLDGESALPPFAMPVGVEASYPDLQKLQQQLFSADGATEIAKAINKLLGGQFYARTVEGDLSSAAEAGLFIKAPSNAAKVWHYLIAFKATAAASWGGDRPIIDFKPLPGIDTYVVEAVANNAFASEVQSLKITFANDCKN